MLNLSLGERIKRRRKELRLTQKDLASKMGLDNTTISKWESNTYEPDTKSLYKLAEILSVTTDYLLGRTDSPEGFVVDYSKAKDHSEITWGDAVEQGMAEEPLYKFQLSIAKNIVNTPSNLIDQGLIRSVIIMAYTAFEIRLNEVLLQSITRGGMSEEMGLDYLKALSFKDKYDSLKKYLNYDIVSEPFYTNLVKIIDLRSKIAHGVFGADISIDKTKEALDTIGKAIDAIDTHIKFQQKGTN